MARNRKAVRPEFGVELMENRRVPSGVGSHALSTSPMPVYQKYP